ncbi:hypothetical protein GCM10027258_89130 [Amycolatopsis stemonae]
MHEPEADDPDYTGDHAENREQPAEHGQDAGDDRGDPARLRLHPVAGVGRLRVRLSEPARVRLLTGETTRRCVRLEPRAGLGGVRLLPRTGLRWETTGRRRIRLGRTGLRGKPTRRLPWIRLPGETTRRLPWIGLPGETTRRLPRTRLPGETTRGRRIRLRRTRLRGKATRGIRLLPGILRISHDVLGLG